MRKNYNWGIIAPGKIAHKFASDLKLVDGALLKAVASRNLERAQSFAEKYKVKSYYEGYEQLAKDPEVDIVYIASPHILHYENTMLCLENGKHVLCEKPLAMNKKQAEEMTAYAKKNNVFLMEACWTRFIPSYIEVRNLALNKHLGEIKHIQADFGFRAEYNENTRLFNRELGGGSLLDIGIYPLFLAIDILGKPDNIKADGIIGTTGVDLSCSFILKYNTGALANLSSTLVAKTATEAIISGTKGRSKINGMWHMPSSVDVYLENEKRYVIFDEKGFGYEHEAIEVQRCLNNGLLESTQMSHITSLNLQEAMDEIRSQIGLRYLTD